MYSFVVLCALCLCGASSAELGREPCADDPDDGDGGGSGALLGLRPQVQAAPRPRARSVHVQTPPHHIHTHILILILLSPALIPRRRTPRLLALRAARRDR